MAAAPLTRTRLTWSMAGLNRRRSLVVPIAAHFAITWSKKNVSGLVGFVYLLIFTLVNFDDSIAKMYNVYNVSYL